MQCSFINPHRHNYSFVLHSPHAPRIPPSRQPVTDANDAAGSIIVIAARNLRRPHVEKSLQREIESKWKTHAQLAFGYRCSAPITLSSRCGTRVYTRPGNLIAAPIGIAKISGAQRSWPGNCREIIDDGGLFACSRPRGVWESRRQVALTLSLEVCTFRAQSTLLRTRRVITMGWWCAARAEVWMIIGCGFRFDLPGNLMLARLVFS